MNPQKRVVVYVPEEDYKKLRASLILAGESVSQWFRDVIRRYLRAQSKI